MLIYKNIPLKKYNSFGLDYLADSLICIKTEKEAALLFRQDIALKKPFLILGSGSNILFTSDFNGTILHPEMSGIRVEKQDKESVIISAGAGVNWDKLVEWTVNKGLGGLENLSLIPGMVGATPVQNIGAYGAEVKDLIEKVRTINISNGSIRIFSKNECDFGYRDSIFKKSEKGKYLITRVYYKLNISPLLHIKYGSLEEEVNKLGSVTLKNVRQAVINIRKSKLPDPGIIGNAGSFFRNPVVARSFADNIKKDFPHVPVYEDQSGGIKVAAAWLIDKCGWKGKRIGDAGVHDKQALVLVNYGKATGTEIYNLSEEIRKSVFNKFRVELEPEVEVVGPI
ncbi:MAG: UDP-N-acetylmuramate dehydrogenase [Bacteroidetes bacterium]|nr:MAG: UDP-N-acetylmuramate dehydrogenase [Bacteroidota bacterium]